MAYFKHCFGESNQRIGSRSDHFCFENDQAKKVIRALQRLKSRPVLSADKAALLEPRSSLLLEREVKALNVSYQPEGKKRRSQAIRRGMR